MWGIRPERLPGQLPQSGEGPVEGDSQAGGRGGHCSWGVGDGVVLIGGQYGHGSLATAELVSGELYTKSTMLFTLKYNIRYILILDIKIHVVGLKFYFLAPKGA